MAATFPLVAPSGNGWFAALSRDVKDSMKASKRALVAGGAGFLGPRLCDKLLADGHGLLCVGEPKMSVLIRGGGPKSPRNRVVQQSRPGAGAPPAEQRRGGSDPAPARGHPFDIDAILP
jgi:hypothetical protein